VEALHKQHEPSGDETYDELDADVMGEYKRHEECLKRSLAALQGQYSKDMVEHNAENMRIMSNNMGLIREITKQRDSNRLLKLAVQAEQARVTNRANRPNQTTVADQTARANELQNHVDALTARLEAAGVHQGGLLGDGGEFGDTRAPMGAEPLLSS